MSEFKGPGLLEVMKSVLASFFGVQSEQNRERDFQHGKPVHYVLIGLVATAMFVLIMWGIVRIILGAAGG
ncbi:MAG: DUF2970 domain-containing protein [Chromatiales bacterium]|jgi:hypothetical protein